jgi:hypothetical protein
METGRPIGLRATCVVGRVVMNKWLERMTENNISHSSYMDDIRAFLHAIRAGWKMWEGRLCFSEQWKDLNLKDGKSSTRRTAEIQYEPDYPLPPMKNGEDLIDLKYPTLDVKIWIMNGRIKYNYFEKPMTASCCGESCGG